MPPISQVNDTCDIGGKYIYSDNPAAAHYCFAENNFMTKIIVGHVNTQAHLQFQMDPNSSSGLVFLLDTRKKKYLYTKKELK